MSAFTRRRFIQLTGSGLLIAVAPNVLAHSSPQRKIGVALLGLGNYSSTQLAPSLQMTEHCELRGIITGSESKIPQWQQKYGIKDSNVYTYDTMDAIVSREKVQDFKKWLDR